MPAIELETETVERLDELQVEDESLTLFRAG